MSGYAAESAESSYKRARVLFGQSARSVFLPAVDPDIREASLERRRRQAQGGVAKDAAAQSFKPKPQNALVVASSDNEGTDSKTKHPPLNSTANALARIDDTQSQRTTATNTNTNRILVKSRDNSSRTNISTPTWHSPWKLSTVLSSHLGWVRSIAFDRTTNELFATGSADRTIKLWNLPKASVGADDALQLTLTGHISPVRGLAFSERHPYLFSCGEDKQVKCWDLNT